MVFSGDEFVLAVTFDAALRTATLEGSFGRVVSMK